jgi:hypothetical protein
MDIKPGLERTLEQRLESAQRVGDHVEARWARRFIDTDGNEQTLWQRRVFAPNETLPAYVAAAVRAFDAAPPPASVNPAAAFLADPDELVP